MRLAGRTALVSGAGNGLGAAIAAALHGAGAAVVLVGRNQTKLTAVGDRLGDRVHVAPCDVTDAAEVSALADGLGDRHIDILVNNAGVAGPVAELVDITAEEWDEVFAVNVRGVHLMCRAFLPAMYAAGNGDVINVASVSGKRPLVRRTPYCASKMAVIGLTSTLAFEAGPRGVRVNSLSPGPVAGPRMERNFRLEAERTGRAPEQAEEDFVSRSAGARMVTETEVADAALAMLSMTGMTGADVDLSMGMVA